MNRDHAGVMVPREALHESVKGTVAEVPSYAVSAGVMGSTGTTYRFEFNTDPAILARVWDGTTTVFSLDTLGGVTASTMLLTTALALGPSLVGRKLSIDGAAPAIDLYVAGGDVQPATLLQTGQVLLGPGGGTIPNVLLQWAATDVLSSPDQFRVTDGVQGKYISGAGKVAAADGDFTVAPTNGMTAVVFNTTDSTTRFSVRANGTWHTTAAL